MLIFPLCDVIVQSDQIWRSSPLWRNFINLWPFIKGWDSIWQHLEPHLANYLCFWANTNCCKWPNIELVITSSDHSASYLYICSSLLERERTSGRMKIDPPIFANLISSFEYLENCNRRIFNHGWVNFPLGEEAFTRAISSPVDRNHNKGSFRLQLFCCNQRLMQCGLINWRFLYFSCNQLYYLLVAAELL